MLNKVQELLRDFIELVQLSFRALIMHVILGYPLFVVIEPINICNLNCPACTAPQKYITRKRRAMSFEEFKIIVDKIKKYVVSIELFFCGEPLLNKDIFKMIRYARQNKLRVTLSTNGTLLYLYAGELVASGLNKLHVSFHGPTKETLEKFMVGARFEDILKGISLVIEKKKRLNKRYPIIELGMVVTRYNENLINEFKQLAKELGVKAVLKELVLATNIYPEDGIKNLLHFIPLNPEWNRYVIKNGKLYPKKIKKTCNWWKSGVILVDGRMCACCYDINGEYCYGNIFKSEFREIWRSPLSRKIRSLVKTRSLPICRSCLE